jgi:L-rhamnose mutarotase
MAERYGSVIKLKREKLDEYRRLHADAWPAVLKTIRECNIRNYSIFLRQLDDGEHYLFSYYEYAGDDYQADLARMAADPTTQEWWAVCKPCQEPLDTRKPGEWWSEMDTVFFFPG